MKAWRKIGGKRGAKKRAAREMHIDNVLLSQAAGLEDRALRHGFVRFAKKYQTRAAALAEWTARLNDRLNRLSA